MQSTVPRSHVTVTSVLGDLPDAPIATSRDRDWCGLTLDLHAAARNYHVDTGAHDHHLICYCPEGNGRLVQRRDGKVHDSVIHAGTTIIMPAGMASVWEGTAAKSARLRISQATFDNAIAELGGGGSFELRNQFETIDPIIERLASLMLIELERPAHPAQHLILESISTAMIAHLWRSYNVFTPRPDGAADRLTPPSIRAVTTFIHDQLHRPLALRDLAAVAGTSQFHLVRQFKRATGMAPAAYVQAARIEWAKQLIATTQHGLAEVALIAGFADQSHFTRRFRHHTGTTPAAYAREKARVAG